jgi:hypothetical protein
MKKLLLAAALLIGLCGCRSMTAKLPGGTEISTTAFACKLSVGSVSIATNGTATLSNYNLDQVAGTQAIAEGVAKGVASGLKP